MESLSCPRPYYFFHYSGLHYERAVLRKLLKSAVEIVDTISETFRIFHWLSELLQLIFNVTSGQKQKRKTQNPSLVQYQEWIVSHSRVSFVKCFSLTSLFDSE